MAMITLSEKVYLAELPLERFHFIREMKLRSREVMWKIQRQK